MKLFSMSESKRPCRAGKAVLRFVEPIREPERHENIIFLPLGPEAEFYPLKGGLQFLFRTPFGPIRPSSWPNDVLFGGEDEDIFLVLLRAEAFLCFKDKGEEGFFEALKPLVIRSFEKKWGAERTRRQGEIFAYELPFSWSELLRNWGTVLGVGYYRKSPIFRTSHRHSGFRSEIPLLWALEGGPLPSRVQVASGRIEAKGHAPLILKGPHVLDQTRYLAKPCGDG